MRKAKGAWVLTRGFLKCILLFVLGGCLYSSIEILYKGSSHWTMTVTGGLCFLLLYFIAVYMRGSIWKKAILAAVIITGIELAVGILVNRTLGWGIWDYSAHPFNYMGQVCLHFSLIWFVFSVIGIWLCCHIHGVLRRLEARYRRFDI